MLLDKFNKLTEFYPHILTDHEVLISLVIGRWYFNHIAWSSLNVHVMEGQIAFCDTCKSSLTHIAFLLGYTHIVLNSITLDLEVLDDGSFNVDRFFEELFVKVLKALSSKLLFHIVKTSAKVTCFKCLHSGYESLSVSQGM